MMEDGDAWVTGYLVQVTAYGGHSLHSMAWIIFKYI